MAGYESLEEDDPNKGMPIPKLFMHAADISRLTIPNSEERRNSSFGFYNRTVLCAVDPSECSRDAFDFYLRQVWRNDDLIILTYCPETPNISAFSFKQRGFAPPIEVWKEVLEDANNKTRTLEEEYEGICIRRKLRYKVRAETHKNAGEGICRIAEEEKADLIVIGSRGLGAVKRAFMGSISEYVLRNSNLPCLVIPGKK